MSDDFTQSWYRTVGATAVRVTVMAAEREYTNKIDNEADDGDWQQSLVLDVRRLEYPLQTNKTTRP